QHQMDAPRSIQLVRMDVPTEVATIVHCLLAKRPEQRFQSGGALAHALEPWCSSAGQSALNPPPVPHAEAADPSAATAATMPVVDPFNFDSSAQVTPTSSRQPPPLPGRSEPKRKVLPLALALAAVVAVFLTVGAFGAAILLRKSGRDKAEVDGIPPVA